MQAIDNNSVAPTPVHNTNRAASPTPLITSSTSPEIHALPADAEMAVQPMSRLSATPAKVARSVTRPTWPTSVDVSNLLPGTSSLMPALQQVHSPAGSTLSMSSSATRSRSLSMLGRPLPPVDGQTLGCHFEKAIGDWHTD